MQLPAWRQQIYFWSSCIGLAWCGASEVRCHRQWCIILCSSVHPSQSFYMQQGLHYHPVTAILTWNLETYQPFCQICLPQVIWSGCAAHIMWPAPRSGGWWCTLWVCSGIHLFQVFQYFSDHCPQWGTVVLDGLLLLVGWQMEENDLLQSGGLWSTRLNDQFPFMVPALQKSSYNDGRSLLCADIYQCIMCE